VPGLVWFFAGPALILAILSLTGERKRAAYFLDRLTRRHASPLPPASVIVPVKGGDEGLRENLCALASQHYPDYELIVVARSAADIPPDVLPDSVRVLLGNGSDEASSEKIQNLQTAVSHVRTRSEVLAFADSDGRVPPNWLAALVTPLAEPQVGASTGYRWYVPSPADFWSLLRSAWNAPIEGLLGPGPNPFAWGGAMAIRKDVFFTLRIVDRWKGQISDDYVLTAAVRQAGLRIAYAPGALVAAVDHIGRREFFAWTKRQMALTRAYNRRLWMLALLAHFFYCAAMIACLSVAASGYLFALVVLGGVVVPGMWKGARRAKLASLALQDYKGWFAKWGWIYSWAAPLVAWVWLVVLASSAAVRDIEWRGRRYRLP
jgi:cellulose synthase/poly-beta-1,6-N-acetylglucosamine synthase-like glycosyltransferase